LLISGLPMHLKIILLGHRYSLCINCYGVEFAFQLFGKRSVLLCVRVWVLPLIWLYCRRSRWTVMTAIICVCLIGFHCLLECRYTMVVYLCVAMPDAGKILSWRFYWWRYLGAL
jgi:hypothetical protein